MRKTTFTFLLLLLAIGLFPVAAIDLKIGPQSTALYHAEDTVMFIAFRTDEDFINRIENIITVLNERVPLEEPLQGLREPFTADVDFETLTGWLGDYGSIGFSSFDVNGMGGEGYAVLELEDQAGAQAYFDEGDYAQSAEGDFTVYTADNSKWAFGDGIVVIGDADMALPVFPLSNALRDSQAYLGSVGQLPEDDYNVVVYLDPDPLLPAGTLPVENIGKIAAGFIIFNDDTFVVDVVSGGGTNPQTVNPEFARFIPANTSAFIHTRDFNVPVNILTSLALLTGEGNARQQLEAGLRQVGIDLEQDVLSWTTGDYALVLRSDLTGALTEIRDSGSIDLVPRFDFGLVIEATDTAKAQVFAGKLNTLLMAMGSSMDGVSVTTETIDGSQMTVITAPVDLGGNVEPSSIDILIGANDEVFIVGTRGFVEALGGDSVVDSQLYQASSAYFLPDPTAIWFADRDGLVSSTVLPVLVLGIRSSVQMPSSSAPTLPVAYRQNDDVQQLLQLIGLFAGSSITSTVTADGAAITRFALTLDLRRE